MQSMKPIAVVFVAAALAPAMLLAQPFGVHARPERPRQERPRPTIPETPAVEDAAPATPESAWDRLDARANSLVAYNACDPRTLPALEDAQWAATAYYKTALAIFGDWREAVIQEEVDWSNLAFEAQNRLDRYQQGSETSGGGHLPELPDDPAFAEARRIYEEVQAERQRRQRLVGQTIDFVLESLETAEAVQAVYWAAIRRADAVLSALHAEVDLVNQLYVLVTYQVRANCRPRLEPPPRSQGPRIWQRWRR